MNEGEARRGGIKWPVCTILILLLVGAVGYWGYAKLRAEQSSRPPHIAAETLQTPEAGPAPSVPPGTAPVARPEVGYRGQLPFLFLAGFSLVMALILGTVLYLWWSLKDLEGGKRAGEEESQGPTRGT